MKKIIRRGAAATLAAVTLVTSAAVPVRAAAPRVQVDETMYVNLDYYGTATQINVVKGCTTNGLTEYTDYGTYDKVVNMTDDTAAGNWRWNRHMETAGEEFAFLLSVYDAEKQRRSAVDV